MKTNIERNKQRRKRRIYNKINKMLKNYRAQFLTLTFSDTTLKRTTEKTRERYIKNYLKSQSAFYIANKDFGSKKEREHYHALIIPTTLKYDEIKNDELKKIKNHINLKAYKYGKIYAKYVNYNGENQSQYLTNHFFKETTKNSRIIQSKKEPSKKEQLKRLEKQLNFERETEKIRLQIYNKNLTNDEILADALEININRKRQNEFITQTKLFLKNK